MIEWAPIRIESILTFIGFALGGLSVAYGFVYSTRNKFDQITLKLGHIVDTFKIETINQNSKIDKQSLEIEKLAQLLIIMARYEERFISQQSGLDRMQNEIDMLRRGEGLIVKKEK